jgi:hypothetical protein
MSWKVRYENQAISTGIDDVHRKYGQDSCAGPFTRPSGAASDSATYNLADFLLGLHSTYTIISPFIFNLRQRTHFFFIQDDWKVNATLILNRGVRDVRLNFIRISVVGDESLLRMQQVLRTGAVAHSTTRIEIADGVSAATEKERAHCEPGHATDDR